MTSLSPVRARPPRSQLPSASITITLVVSVIAALVAYGALSPAPRRTNALGGPSIRLDPSQGTPGTSVRVRGRGLPVEGTLGVTWDGTRQATSSASATGALASAFTVPPAGPGPHLVAVVDATGTRLAGATFTVLSAAGPSPTPIPTPSAAATPTGVATPAPSASPMPSPVPTAAPTSTPGSAAIAPPTSTAAPTPTPSPGPSPSRSPTGPSSSTSPTAAPRPTPKPAPTPTPTSTPRPASTAAPTPTPASTPVSPGTVRWALIGNDGTHLSAERSAGLTTKVFELGWSSYESANGTWNGSYIAAKRSEAASLRAAGFTLILSLGVQYTPSWLMSLPNAHYVDQYGTAYADTSSGSGLANLIWNDDLRALEGRYIARVFSDLGTDWAAVRIGGGRYGELGYPVASYGAQTNTYWAFDANAAKTDPVPGWKPGMASPNGEASKFANWYMDRLANYAAWQARTVRSSYAGRLMVLFPSFGIRPGQLAAAVSGNLSGATSPEKNGEVPRGYDYARQVAALSSLPGIVLTSTWLDCPYGSDASTSPVDWRPIHYLTYLAGAHGMARYGENTGQASASVLRFTASQAKTYGLLGFAWFNERELLSGSYATLSDLAAVIRAN